jgi:hypothetical protein
MLDKYHSALWTTVNHIAEQNRISCSRLAIICGLDSTAFNVSKRKSKYGQLRWLSGDSLVKIIRTTNMTPVQFAEIYQHYLDETHNEDN